jgi:hypothetical protein
MGERHEQVRWGRQLHVMRAVLVDPARTPAWAPLKFLE